MNTYSPQPPSSYFIPGVDRCEIRMLTTEHPTPIIWNLYWMSYPRVDNLVGATPNGWWLSYRPYPELLKAVCADALQDERMRYMLGRPPAEFYTWFSLERDYTIYDCWSVAGNQWVETVLDRADQAAMTRLGPAPFIYGAGGTLNIDLSRV